MPEHPHLEMPRGVAALAPLLRAGLRPPTGAILGIVESERRGTSAWTRTVRTLHLDPACDGGFSLNATRAVAALADDLIAAANHPDGTEVYACVCQPVGLAYGTWLDDRSELAALLAAMEYAEEEYTSCDPAYPPVVGALRRVVHDFTDSDRTETVTDPTVDAMTGEALAALVEMTDDLAARVDVDHLDQQIARRAGGDGTSGTDVTAADPMVRCLLRLPPIAFDGELAAGYSVVYGIIGVHGILPPGDGGRPNPMLALHVPASAASTAALLANVVELGPAVNTCETAADLFGFHTQVQQLTRNLGTGHDTHADRVTAAVGILTAAAQDR